MRLLLFNPENDLALASNDPHYTPPASARRMAADLADFPRWWQKPDDVIMLPDAPSRGSYASAETILPWGWSPLLLTQLKARGVPAELLPTDAQMQRFRTLAGRATAKGVLERVRKRLETTGYGGNMAGEAHCCRSWEDVEQIHSKLGETLLKQPWSGSGRGLHPLHGSRLGEKDEAWVGRTLREQGYVMAEPIYNKVEDLAAEFWCHADGRVTFEGLSLFQTTAGGVYAGNLIAAEDEKRRRLAQRLPLAWLDAAVEALEQELSALDNGFYVGPVGVDMMIVACASLGEKNVSLHPCVEINFRMTMGWVALQLMHRLGKGQMGTFHIVHENGGYRAEVKFC